MRPKVLMFGWEFPPHNSGGLGTACLGLTRALSKENVDVLFVLPKKIEVDDRYAKMLFPDDEQITIESIDTLLSGYMTDEKYLIDKSHVEKLSNFYGKTLMEEVKRYAYKARAIAKREKFDVIHAHDWLSFLAGKEAKKVSGKPLIVHVHATEYDRTGGHGVNEQVYKIEREVMHEADSIIAVSQLTKDTILEHYGIQDEKVIVVHNGMDLDIKATEPLPSFEALKANGEKIVLFLARITIQKGPEYFIEAARMALKHNPNITFVIVGTGDMSASMIDYVAKLGLSEKIIFTGRIVGKDVMRIYAASDLFVMPSVSEPFGLTPLESIVNGTPVIISKTSGVSEVLQHALKIDFWDTEELANMIVTTLENPVLSNTLLENSKAEVPEINWEKAAKKCMAIYRHNIEKFALKPHFKTA